MTDVRKGPKLPRSIDLDAGHYLYRMRNMSYNVETRYGANLEMLDAISFEKDDFGPTVYTNQCGSCEAHTYIPESDYLCVRCRQILDTQNTQ